jgi:hypothetical protein
LIEKYFGNDLPEGEEKELEENKENWVYQKNRQ